VTLSDSVFSTNGNVTFNGNISLISTPDDTYPSSNDIIYNYLTVNAGTVFTQNSNIDSLVVNNGNLWMSGGGQWMMNSEIGKTTSLNNTGSFVGTTFGGTEVNTYGSQSCYAPINLVNDTQFISQNGNVRIYTTIDGAHPFTASATNSELFVAQDIGQGVAVESINLSANSLNLQGGAYISSGNTHFRRL
jgi:hypothetical protein